MTPNQSHNLLQLLISKDPNTILLALEILKGFKEIDLPIKIILGLLLLSQEKEITSEAEKTLMRFISKEQADDFVKTLYIFKKSHNLFHNSNLQSIGEKYLHTEIHPYFHHHETYKTLIPLNNYFLELYLRMGIFGIALRKKKAVPFKIFHEAVLQYYPQHPYALFGLANYYRTKQDNSKKCLFYYHCFIQYHPNLRSNQEMINLYRFSTFKQIDLPTTFNAYQHLASYYQASEKNYQKAIEYYQQANELSPSNISLRFSNWGRLVWEYNQDFQAALDIAQEGLNVLNQHTFPTDILFNGLTLFEYEEKSALYELMGDIHLQELEAIQQASNLYEKAIRNSSNSILLYLKQIRILFEQLKDYQQAIELCQKALGVEELDIPENNPLDNKTPEEYNQIMHYWTQAQQKLILNEKIIKK